MTNSSIRPSSTVAIIGGGPSGLALGIELGRRGVKAIIIEREPRAGWAPRAKTTHTRTREHMRRWGIAEKLAQATPFGVDYPSDVHFVTRLGGKSLTVMENAMNCAPAKDDRYAEHAQWVPQYKLEAVLRDYATSLNNVELRFGHEFMSFEQDENTVRVAVHDIDLDTLYTIEADYLVGADGASSTLREKIGAVYEGTYGLSRNYNIIFRAPGLAQAHPHGPGIMYWQINDEGPSLIGPMDEGDLWFFMPTMLSKDKTLTDDEAIDLIKSSTGIDLDYEIISSDFWTASRFQANKYSQDRVFLVGDACHVHPPFGGYGMNMGVADSVDLGWKMAAVLQGWGGANLLETYILERGPVHTFVLDEAVHNHETPPNYFYTEGLDEEGQAGEAKRDEVARKIRAAKANEFYALGVMLGYRYDQSPIIVKADNDPAWTRSPDYVPTAIPGARAPHKWLPDGRSLYDRFGEDFTLLVFESGKSVDVEMAQAEASELGIPLKVVKLTDQGLLALYAAPLTLIRPDQHVAWRGERWPETEVFRTVTGRHLTASAGKTQAA